MVRTVGDVLAYVCEACLNRCSDHCGLATDIEPLCVETVWEGNESGARCHPSVKIYGVIQEPGYWLARHPFRAADHDGPEASEDDWHNSLDRPEFEDSEEDGGESKHFQ